MLALNNKRIFSLNQLFSGLKDVFSAKTNTLTYFYAVLGGQKISAYHYKGEQTISLNNIVGSMNESRCHDFDANFNLLATHSQSRLNSVKNAWKTKKLPPISLIEFDGSYYVQDGHHRVAITKSHGQDDIVAMVTAVEVSSAYSDQPLSLASA